MAHDFSQLTRSQQALLTFQGWVLGVGVPQPSMRTVQKLLDRGLLTQHERQSNSRFGGVAYFEYSVPLDVHMAWCERCSLLEDKREAKLAKKAAV